MQRRIFLGTAALVALMTCTPAMADGVYARATAFLSLEIDGNSAKGTLWLDKDTLESRYQIDRDGDVSYSSGELMASRGPIATYVNQNLFVLWGGKIHPITFEDMVLTRRPGNNRNFLKISFSIKDYSGATQVVVVSRLLADFWHGSHTRLFLKFGNRQNVFGLDASHYADTQLMESASSQPTAAGASKTRKYACPQLCVGMESNTSPMKCPRCGAAMIEALGATQLGVGDVGRLGGALMPYYPGAHKLEALLTTDYELRLYMLDEALAPHPIGRITGQVTLWTDQKMESTTMERKLETAADNAYLYAKIPPTSQLPLRARFTLNRPDNQGMQLIDFYIPELINLAP